MRGGARGGPAGCLFAALGIGALAGLFVAISSISRSPNLEGVLTGVFAGGFLALIIGGIGAWGAMLMVGRIQRAQTPAAPPTPQDERLHASLGDTLAALEAARLETAAKIRSRMRLRIPLGVIAAFVLWMLSQATDDPADFGDLLLFGGFGGFGGYLWASLSLSEAYRKRYKQQVLPALAAQFGDLTWRPAQPPIAELQSRRLFAAFDNWTAEDEIVGRHRDVDVSLLELRLTHGSGKNQRTIFNGLLTAVTLPRTLAGSTVITSDKGGLGNMFDGRDGMRRVRVEDPDFEKAYEVWGTDQIAARALLTPAFMQRFMALASSGRFGAPLAMAEDNRLIIAMPSFAGRNLFEPPSYSKPAAAREAVTAMADDIRSVLAAADAALDLDFLSRRRLGRSRADEGQPTGDVGGAGEGPASG